MRTWFLASAIAVLLGASGMIAIADRSHPALAQTTGELRAKADRLLQQGVYQHNARQFHETLQSWEEALTIYRQIRDRYGEGASLNNLGIFYELLGEYPRAIDYYEQSLTILRNAGNRARNRNGEAGALHNLGNLHSSLGDYNRAIDYYIRSFNIKKETRNSVGQGTSLVGLGNAYRAIGNYELAIRDLEHALYMQGSNGDLFGRVTSLNSLGLVYRDLKDYPQAIDYYQQALDFARETGKELGQGDSLYHLAESKYLQGDVEAALKDIEASIALAESIRASLDNPNLRQSFFATVSDRYQLYIEILMQLHRENGDRGYDRQALHASERNRARTLTELLAEANLDIRQNADPQLLAEEQRLAEAFSNLEKRRLELTSGSYSNADLNRLTAERDRLLKALSDLETRIRRQNPAYADLKYPQSLTLDEIQAQILDSDTLLLEYALGKERSYLFAVGKTEFSVYELPPKKEIEDAVEKYATALQAEDRNPLPEGKDLAQMLLRPVADKLQRQRLAIVADGKLHRLPFGALPWGAGASIAPLLANHEIVNLSSASSLAIQRQQSNKRSPATKKIAVFADPVFSRRDPRLSGEAIDVSDNALLDLFRDGCGSFDRLRYTRTEAENILSLVPDDREFLAIDFEADRAAAMGKELAQYEILHLSTHGCIQDNPQLSGLALSLYDENGQQQDGFLRLQDIYNLQLNADLVVLSACQTGIGEEVSGEGVVGLTRGFMYAGARRVTVSLWNVSDIATANLMSDYYQNMLSENMSPPAALREAQLQMWRAGEYPYKWAAFTIQGDWR